MDHGTGWTLAVPLTSHSADAMLELLREITTTYSKPTTILTDNGAEIESDAVQLYFCH